jgi:hypothetical protein
MVSDPEVAETHFPGCQANYGELSSCYSGQDTYRGGLAGGIGGCGLRQNQMGYFEGFGSFKSTGEDGIFPGLLKKLNCNAIWTTTLVKIFTACLALGYIPGAWQRVRVIFIPKPGPT